MESMMSALAAQNANINPDLAAALAAHNAATAAAPSRPVPVVGPPVMAALAGLAGEADAAKRAAALAKRPLTPHQGLRAMCAPRPGIYPSARR